MSDGVDIDYLFLSEIGLRMLIQRTEYGLLEQQLMMEIARNCNKE